MNAYINQSSHYIMHTIYELKRDFTHKKNEYKKVNWNFGKLFTILCDCYIYVCKKFTWIIWAIGLANVE